MLDAIRYLQRRGTRVTKLKLANALRQPFGFDLPRASTYHTNLLNWISHAGLSSGAKGRFPYRINEDRVAQLIGLKQADREDWQMLSADQTHVALALRSLSVTHGPDWLPARDVYDYAMNQYGLEAPEDQLNNQIFRPLEDGGWVERFVRRGGRGGKSGSIRPTPKLLDLSLDIVSKEPKASIPPDLSGEPLDKIHKHLASHNKGTKGIALELLALRMVNDLGLTPTGFRFRSSQMGGAEVDLTAEGAHLIFSRWSFQCVVTNTTTCAFSKVAIPISLARSAKFTFAVFLHTQSSASEP